MACFRKNIKQNYVLLLFSLFITIGVCDNIEKSSAPIMRAKYTPIPIKLDGKLDELVWTTATVYHLYLSKRQQNREEKLAEPGEVCLAWDDKYFYLAIKFYDSDIIAKGTKDQMRHYKWGDVVELFLKPEHQTWYWEIYATPRNHKSSFWLPRHKKGLIAQDIGLQVATYCEGTLNNSSDKDKFWTTEIAIPLKKLGLAKQQFGVGEQWRILVARYNHKRYLRHAELSMMPQLSKADYHRYQEYAILQLVK